MSEDNFMVLYYVSGHSCRNGVTEVTIDTTNNEY